MKRIEETKLLDVALRLLRAEGCPAAEAELVARHLVDANLKGHDSHGVGMLETYVKHAKAGTLDPKAHGRVTNEATPFLQVDGERGHGQVVAHDATRRALEIARRDGACILGIRNAHHMGRIGTYGEMATAAGLVGIFVVNVVGHRGLVAPHGGAEGRLGTNPICIAVPGPTLETPFLLDMATSKVAVGKLRVSMAKGELLPEGLALDGHGKPTRDPGVIWAEPGGAVLPVGDHKGYGLGLAVDILAGALVGGGTLQPDNPRPGTITNNLFAIIVDPARMGSLGAFSSEVDAVLRYMKDSPRRDPGTAVLTAGEPERIAQADRRANGIPVDDGTWASLQAAAEVVGITL
jgi:hydroxycarboxylate dehydrogenase B